MIQAEVRAMSSSDEAASAVPKPGNKRMSIERIYQKKTQLEHILLRPDTYIGSTESYSQVRSARRHLIILVFQFFVYSLTIEGPTNCLQKIFKFFFY